MPETTELMKRPKESDCIVQRRALEMFMPAMKSYLGEDWSESEQPHIEEQLMKVMRLDDGYAMARELERRYYWEEDRGLVDIMDDLCHKQYEAHKELLGQWVKCYDITPARKIGDVVSTTQWHRKGQVGTIEKIYEEDANYGVHFPEQPATSMQILHYEEVIDAPEGYSVAGVVQQTSAHDAPEFRGVQSGQE